MEIKTSKYGDFDYPIGRILDIELHFMHFHSFEEAREKWESRKQRIVWDQIRIIDVAREGWTDEHLAKFQSIQYPKILLANKDYGLLESVNIDFYQNKLEVGEMIGDGKIWYYYFDVPLFLNTGEVKRRKLLSFLFRKLSRSKTI